MEQQKIIRASPFIIVIVPSNSIIIIDNYIGTTNESRAGKLKKCAEKEALIVKSYRIVQIVNKIYSDNI